MTEIVDLVLAVLRTSTPLVFAALGVLVAERSGVMHIGVEGVMLLGAFAGVLAAVKAGPWTGVLLAVAAGAAAGLLLALLTVVLPTDQVVLGLAFNTACIGITSFLFRLTAAEMQRLTPPLTVPVPAAIRDAPGVSALLSVPPLAWLAVALAVGTWWFLFRTGPGLIVRSVGHSSEAAVAAGIDVRAVRVAALVVAGAVSGLAGAALTVGWVRSFTDNITLGRGFIGLAAVYFGRWHPGLAVAACLVFGVGDALAPRAQGAGANPHYYLMLPYLLTIAVVALTGRSQAPREVGRPYVVGA